MARVVLPGTPHHVTPRGLRSMRVFLTDAHRRQYLRLLVEQAHRSASPVCPTA